MPGCTSTTRTDLEPRKLRPQPMTEHLKAMMTTSKNHKVRVQHSELAPPRMAQAGRGQAWQGTSPRVHKHDTSWPVARQGSTSPPAEPEVPAASGAARQTEGSSQSCAVQSERQHAQRHRQCSGRKTGSQGPALQSRRHWLQ